MNWRKWKIGLIVAGFTGLLNGVLFLAVDMTAKQIAILLVVNFAKDALLYLKQHNIEAVSFDTETRSKPPVAIWLLGALLAGAMALGCRTPLQPGADALVVRAEQFEQQAKASLQFVLETDHLDREFFKASLPSFHAFCSDLRAPVPYQVTNTLPRWRVAVLTLDDSILAYKSVKSASGSNALVAAQLSLSNLVSLANSWVLVATNLSR